MPLYWLCYQHNTQIPVVIEAAPSLVHARMRASLAGLDGIRRWGCPMDLFVR
jgi:hypothetical protein